MLNVKNISCLMAVSLLLGVGCKQEETNQSSSASTQSPSASMPDLKSEGCSVEAVTGGAQITCGDTNTFISSGSVSAPKIPVLINGSSNPAAPEKQIGDYLISVAKNNDVELITVWVEKENAILQYENGIVYPRDQGLYYNSSDCSGDGIYNSSPTGVFGRMGMSERIVYWDRYYRVKNQIEHCYPRSKKEKDGSCTEITGPMSGDFNGFIAEPADPGITTVLSRGYRVKVR